MRAFRRLLVAALLAGGSGEAHPPRLLALRTGPRASPRPAWLTAPRLLLAPAPRDPLLDRLAAGRLLPAPYLLGGGGGLGLWGRF